MLLHVARQPGDELVAQREQLLRRAGRQRTQPCLAHVEQRAIDAAGRQHLRYHLLGDLVDARCHELGDLVGLKPPKNLGHAQQLPLDDVGQPPRHHARFARHDALAVAGGGRVGGWEGRAGGRVGGRVSGQKDGRAN